MRSITEQISSMQKYHRKSIIAFALGVVGVPMSYTIIPPIISFLAILFGFMAKAQIKQDPKHFKGVYVSVFGIILGFVGIVVYSVVMYYFISTIG